MKEKSFVLILDVMFFMFMMSLHLTQPQMTAKSTFKVSHNKTQWKKQNKITLQSYIHYHFLNIKKKLYMLRLIIFSYQLQLFTLSNPLWGCF